MAVEDARRRQRPPPPQVDALTVGDGSVWVRDPSVLRDPNEEIGLLFAF